MAAGVDSRTGLRAVGPVDNRLGRPLVPELRVLLDERLGHSTPRPCGFAGERVEMLDGVGRETDTYLDSFAGHRPIPTTW